MSQSKVATELDRVLTEIENAFSKSLRYKEITIKFVCNGSYVDGVVYTKNAMNGPLFETDENKEIKIYYNPTALSSSDTLCVIPASNYITAKNSITISTVANTTYEVACESATFNGAVTSSRTMAFTTSEYPNGIEIWGCGGGGSGAACVTIAAMAGTSSDCYPTRGSGGAGGYTGSITIPSSSFPIILTFQIGSGGASASATGKYTSSSSYTYNHVCGNAGSSTIVTDFVSSDTLLTVSGGSGGLSQKIHGTVTSTTGAFGANGGSGSGAVYTNACATYQSSTTIQKVGDAGSDGSDGGTVTDTTDTSVYTGGSGQGTTTRSFGESSGTLYCSAGAGVAGTSYSAKEAVLGTCDPGAGSASGGAGDQTASDATTYGSGGGAAAGLALQSDKVKVTAESGAGCQGIILIRGIS